MVSIPRAGLDWSVGQRYEIRREIGQGSYGHVCEAVDTATGEAVAIKRFERIFRDTLDTKRILREIAILPHLKSSFIANLRELRPVHDCAHFEDLYAVLELAESDLKKVVRSSLVLRHEHVQVIMYRALCGLQYIHSAGVIHRDLKPGNILINSDCSVKLCDFGLAREGVSTARCGTSDLLAVSDLQKLTKHIATRWYRAPEVVLLSPYSAPVDVWSMGCVFGELLGKMPGAQHKGALFPGKTCYPMSPLRRSAQDGLPTDLLEADDQLNVIFSVIGTPDESQLRFLRDENTKLYVCNFPQRAAVDFRDWFPNAPAEALDLLQRMLAFSPEQRISVAEALSHSYFRRVRNQKSEELAQTPVSLSFDSEQELTADELRTLILREIARYHPSDQKESPDCGRVRSVEDLLKRAPVSTRLFPRGGSPAL